MNKYKVRIKKKRILTAQKKQDIWFKNGQALIYKASLNSLDLKELEDSENFKVNENFLIRGL